MSKANTGTSLMHWIVGQSAAKHPMALLLDEERKVLTKACKHVSFAAGENEWRLTPAPVPGQHPPSPDTLSLSLPLPLSHPPPLSLSLVVWLVLIGSRCRCALSGAVSC
jgi:hypothetical protein